MKSVCVLISEWWYLSDNQEQKVLALKAFVYFYCAITSHNNTCKLMYSNILDEDKCYPMEFSVKKKTKCPCLLVNSNVLYDTTLIINQLVVMQVQSKTFKRTFETP